MARAPAAQRVQTVCLVILATIGVAASLYWLRPVMIPFVLSVFVLEAISPILDVQTERLKIPRPLAVFTTLLAALLLFGLIASLVSTSVGQLAANAAGYQAKLTRLLESVVHALPLERFGIDPAAALRPLTEIPAGSVGRMLLGTTNAILETLSQGALVAVFLLFLVLGSGARGKLSSGVWWEVESRIKRYVVTKVAISAVTGALVTVILLGLGVDLALVFGLFAFLLNFIPSIGSVIATLLPLPVVIASPDLSLAAAIGAIAGPAAVQVLIGTLLEPKIIGESLDLHPVVLVMALIFWGMLWGIVGMLLAAPIMAVLKILLEKFEATRTLADILAGRLEGLRTAS